MTYDEVVKAFPIGCEVVLMVNRMAAKIGATGKVYKHSTNPYGEIYIHVKWDRTNPLCDGQADGGYYPKGFELVSNCKPVIISHQQSNSCPRCNGKLVKKEAEEPFTGKKYSIDKCQDCGWC